MSPSIYNLPHRSTSGGSDAVFSLPQNQKDLSIVKDKEGRLWRIVDINGQGVNQSQIKAANQLAQTILAQSPRKADMSKEADEKSSLGILNSSNPDSMIITMDYDTTSSVLTANIVEKKDNASIDTGIKPISIKDNSDKDIENVLKDLVSKTENVAKDILIQPKIGQGSKVLVEDEAVDVDGIEVLDKQDAAAIEIDEIDDKEDSESARLIPSQPPVQLDDDKLAAPNLANPELIYEGMGKEQVEGFAAVKNTIDNAKEAILSLQYQLADPNVVDKQPIQDAILYYKNKIQNATSWAEKYGGWINSNGWRDLIHDTKDYFTAVDQFIACPVNMRYHSFAKDMMSSPQGVIRMAVITDVRNGWFNLQDLDILKKKSPASLFLLKKITDKIIDAITGKSKFKSSILENATLSKIFGKFFNNLSVLKHNDSLSPQQYIEAAIQEINTSLNTAEGKSRLQLQSALYGLTQLLNTLDDKKLEGIIAERERFLGDQMLQLIAGQVDKNPHLLEGETFKMAHVGLLNGFANSLDSTGWVHDEGNEIADMAAIFQRFDGYEIILNSDVKTPSFSKGKIYLPLPAGQEGVKRMKLQTFYSNCSPQVNTSNWGTQKQVNEETLKQWQQAGQADNLPATFTKELIGAQKSSYTMAVDLEFDLIQAGFAVSTGCQSAKDRTGVVVGLLMQKLLEKANGITPDNNPHRGKVLTSDGLAIQIAGQNTGDKTLKVDPLQISTSTAREKLSLTLHSIKSFGEQVIANNVSKLWKKRPLVQKDQYPRVHPQRHFTQLSSSAGVKRVSLAAISESDEKAAQERSGA